MFLFSHICRRTTAIFSFFAMNISFGQNLVANPSFEKFNECPTEYGMLSNSVPSCNAPTLGSTDFFHSCSPNMPAKRNFIGHQTPVHGEGYAGIYMYGPRDYREYITSDLQARLIKDRKYTLSFWVSLADKSGLAVDQFGVLFTKNPLKLKTKRNIPINLMYDRGYKNYMEVVNINSYDDKDNWINVTGEYVADGTENYLTIGNFKGNINTRVKGKGEKLKRAAYYYIDMISLVEREPSYELNEIYTLNNLLFDTNDFKIKEESFPQLDSLVTYLRSNKYLKVSIHGHTDNIGSKKHNADLSKKRAKSVAIFLIENGLKPNRVDFKGFGDIKPLVDNKTASGRLKNRRVEFTISDGPLEVRESLAETLFEDDN